MSSHLFSQDKDIDFRFTNSGWYEVLRLASEFGWRPIGTVLEDCPDWKGRYDSNDYQKVRAEDALALAAAVETATQSPMLKPDWADYLRLFVDFARQSGGFRIG